MSWGFRSLLGQHSIQTLFSTLVESDVNTSNKVKGGYPWLIEI